MQVRKKPSKESLFYNNMMDPSYLKAELIKQGCDKGLIEEVMNLNVIKNYSNLYFAFTRLPDVIRSYAKEPWQLLCLSGEPSAFDYAYNLGMKAITHFLNHRHGNPLHWAVLSGVPAQVDKALERGFPWDSTSRELNILHCAALSGVPAQLNKVLAIQSNKRKELEWETGKNINLLHMAAWTGVPEQVEEVIKQGFVSPSTYKRTDADGLNALDYALKSGNEETIQKVRALGLTPTQSYVKQLNT